MSFSLLGPYFLDSTTICFRGNGTHGVTKGPTQILFPEKYGPYSDITIQLTRSYDITPHYNVSQYSGCQLSFYILDGGFKVSSPVNDVTHGFSWIAHATVPSKKIMEEEEKDTNKEWSWVYDAIPTHAAVFIEGCKENEVSPKVLSEMQHEELSYFTGSVVKLPYGLVLKLKRALIEYAEPGV